MNRFDSVGQMRQRPSTSSWSLPVDEAMRNTLWKVRKRGNHGKEERERKAEAIQSECNSISFSLVSHCISRRHCRHCYSSRLLHSMGYIDLAMGRSQGGVACVAASGKKCSTSRCPISWRILGFFNIMCCTIIHYIVRIENMGFDKCPFKVNKAVLCCPVFVEMHAPRASANPFLIFKKLSQAETPK